MCSRPRRSFALALLFLSSVAAPLKAQLHEDVGTRAQGMAGAFVAVSDDATATWWNPAGIATGAIFNALLEKGRVTEPESPVFPNPARRVSASGFAIAAPSLGLSYYRIRGSQMELSPASPTGANVQNRQDVGGDVRPLRTLAISQFGVTVAQTLLDHVVAASTVKVVRGGPASGTTDGSTDPLDAADDLDVPSETHMDLDLGAMVAFQHVRVGLSVRNVRQLEFGDSDDAVTVKRQSRAGVAILGGPNGPLNGFTVSADADLTKSTTVFGEVRHAAVGGELWLLNRRLGVRGGAAANTIGERRPSYSTGVSLAVMRSLYIDGARTFGSDDSIRGWSSSVRVAF